MSLNGGYAMIKYNSTQEELQIAYKSKRPALFYDENQRAHWAVIEETATQSVDEETQEPITIYQYSYRLLDEDSGGSNLLEDIVDKNGNKRFIEDKFIIDSNTYSGITFTYNKWSLSGTHLMLVIAGTCVTGANLNGRFASYEFPDYIINKIIPRANSSKIVEEKLVPFKEIRNVGREDQNTNMILEKENGKIYINSGALNANAERYFRIQFDMLIDSE